MIILLTAGTDNYRIQGAREIPEDVWRALRPELKAAILRQDELDTNYCMGRDARIAMESVCEDPAEFVYADQRLAELKHARDEGLAQLNQLREKVLSYPAVEIGQLHFPFDEQDWGVDEIRRLN